jgi:hypothetical protein
MTGFKIFAMAVILAGCLFPVPARAQIRKDRNGTKIPDVQVLTLQYLERSEPDDPGDIPPITVIVTVRNNTRDRTITGILWKIEIKDAKTGKVLETLHPYTHEGAFNPGDKMSIPPNWTADVKFVITRTVHTQNTREAVLAPDDYAYITFDKTRDHRPSRVELYSPEPWPFKSHSGPVLQDSESK